MSKKIYSILLFLSFGFTSIAQENVLYQFNNQAQAIKLNPAYQPECKLFVGIPALSNLKLSYDNRAFSYKQLFSRTQDSITFNLDGLTKNLGLNNHIRLSFETDILSIGYKYKDIYFMFNYGHQTSASINFPKDIFQIINGNWNSVANVPTNLDFSSIGVYVQSYNNISLSVSKPINKQLSVGARLSYLKGITNLSNFNRNLSLLTSAYPISLTALVNSQINTAGFLNIQIPSQIGSIPSATIDNSQLSVLNLLLPKNNGFSIDLGLVYKYTDVLTINASVRNLGYIKWKINPSNIIANGSYAFNGVNFDQYLAGNSSSGNIVQTLKDSVLNSFSYSTVNESYTDALPLHVMFSGDYYISDKTKATGLVHTIIYDQVIEASATAGITHQIAKKLKGNFSLSYLNSSINMGGGIIIGKKNAQFYLLTENVPIRFAKISATPILIPYSAQTLNLQMGLNFKFGCVDKKKKSSRSNTVCPAYKSPRKISKPKKRKAKI